MRIVIPEIEEVFGKGATAFDSFKALQFLLIILTRDFKDVYKPGLIKDIDGIEAYFILDILKTLSTLELICKKADYNSGNTLCRSLVDKMSIFKLVFANANSDERKYRYYLYIIDGMRERKNLLNEKLEYDGKITKEEFKKLSMQYNSAYKNTIETIEFCEKELNKHPYSSLYPEFHKQVLEKGCWQYIELGKIGKKGKISFYKWEDLYELLDKRGTIKKMFSKFLSQYVHGLSMSILPNQDCFENLEGIISIGVCMQGVVIDEIMSRYANKTKLKNNFTMQDMMRFKNILKL